MSANTITDEAVAALDSLWGLATVEVIDAQRAYAELSSSSDDDDGAVGAAWLRLWRAEERQRQVGLRFDA
jgi:hypothetical protein